MPDSDDLRKLCHYFRVAVSESSELDAAKIAQTVLEQGERTLEFPVHISGPGDHIRIINSLLDGVHVYNSKHDNEITLEAAIDLTGRIKEESLKRNLWTIAPG
ncbi:MAG TPA: hypothetical protein VIG74_07590 [Alphaproteobacteria bacterium]|jgi:hypothetical protein